MEDLPEHWRNVVEAAHLTVQRAEQGDANAGHDVLADAIIGLRSMLHEKEPADPHRIVCLHALLKSLERIENGEEPATALNLKQGHRRPDPAKDFRDVMLFVSVGKALDALIFERGHTRQDSPVTAALKLVAKREGHRIPTVQKAWGMFGGESGWAKKRADWK